MTLQNTKKLANHICRLLKVSDIIIPIGRTSKGNFGLRFSANQEEYEMYLDAIPLSTKSIIDDDNNIELKKMVERYVFDDSIKSFIVTNSPIIPQETIPTPTPKKRGRPAKQE